MSKYEEAVRTRAAKKASNTVDSKSLLDWAKDGVSILSHYRNVGSEYVTAKLETIAPSDPEARVQKEVVDKINRDELIDQFQSAGRVFGSKVATVAGTTAGAGWAFLKSAIGQVSKEAKARLNDLDGPDTTPSTDEPVDGELDDSNSAS